MQHQLVDIGVNLAHRSFRGDWPEVVERALRAGVTRMVVTGTSEEASETAVELARQRRGALWSTAGVHPHHAKTFGAGTLRLLEALAREPEVVAIGECGLDYDRDFSPRPVQRSCFEAQLELAAELGMPVFLHERAAHADLIEIIARHRDRLTSAVVHCFTGSERELDAYLELDLHIGITGWICDARRGAHLVPLVARIPSNRLMIETDAPFLHPTLKRQRNEPALLPHVLDAVARGAELPAETVARQTTATSLAFFGISSAEALL